MLIQKELSIIDGFPYLPHSKQVIIRLIADKLQLPDATIEGILQ